MDCETYIEIELNYVEQPPEYARSKTLSQIYFWISISGIFVDILAIIIVIAWVDTFLDIWWLFLVYAIISSITSIFSIVDGYRFLILSWFLKIIFGFIVMFIAVSAADQRDRDRYIAESIVECRQLSSKYNIIVACDTMIGICFTQFRLLAANFKNKAFECL